MNKTDWFSWEAFSLHRWLRASKYYVNARYSLFWYKYDQFYYFFLLVLLFKILYLDSIQAPKVSWVLLDSWQNSTLPIHHIFFNFLFLGVFIFSDFDLASLRVLWSNAMVKAIYIGYGLIDCRFESRPRHFFHFSFPKRAKNWVKT